jgi:hypothetical protein
MKTEECLSKNEIRSRSVLGSLNFVFSSMFRLYTAPLVVASLLSISARLEQRFDFINKLFAVQKKN